MNRTYITTPEQLEDERDFDTTLRPNSLHEFWGQEKIVNNLRIFISAAKQRKEPLDHVLLTGPPGLGKTTLAHIIANEMGKKIHITSGPILDKPYNLAGMLLKLEQDEILFIDEIHRLNTVVEEYLYSAMEDFRLDIINDSGPNASSVQLEIKKFTLVGATTRAGLLSAPLRSRFGIPNRLDYYTPNILLEILRRSSKILGVEAKEQGLQEIALRSRGTPRIANRLLKRCRDFAQADPSLKEFKRIITKEVAQKTLNELEVDSNGLDEMDKRILLTIIEKFKGGPVGVGTIAAAVGEEAGTIEEVYEPYLMQEGFLHRTPRGREATEIAYKHFGMLKKVHTGSSLFPTN
ncbi:MAG: Holliday junction branch migration DNA helicase RuvB [Ignavibacteria bacterium]|nr:Holliday junction branch migration DNA helicase RuvB [Ignavibacteria bacterium]